MRFTYKIFEFEIIEARNTFTEAEINSYGKMEEFYLFQIKNIHMSLIVKKDNIGLDLYDKASTFESLLLYMDLFACFNDIEDKIELYQFIRTKSPYKVKLLAKFGPAIKLEGENLK